MPVLLLEAERDTITPAAATLRAASRSAKVEVVTYPNGHFDYYQGEGFEQAVSDELAFLRKHLGLRVLTSADHVKKHVHPAQMGCGNCGGAATAATLPNEQGSVVRRAMFVVLLVNRDELEHRVG